MPKRLWRPGVIHGLAVLILVAAVLAVHAANARVALAQTGPTILVFGATGCPASQQ